MKLTDPKIVSVEEVGAAHDFCVRLAKPRELPSRYIPSWPEITCCAHVERDRKTAWLVIRNPCGVLLVNISKDRVDQPFGCAFRCIEELSSVLDDVGVPCRSKDQDADRLQDRKSLHTLGNDPYSYLAELECNPILPIFEVEPWVKGRLTMLSIVYNI